MSPLIRSRPAFFVFNLSSSSLSCFRLPPPKTGIFRVCYGMLLVQRTLAFMSSGAVDASFTRGATGPKSPGEVAATSLFNFGHGFFLLGELGSPSADAVRSVCWCLCAAGAAISVGFRPNAVAFTASVMQVSSHRFKVYCPTTVWLYLPKVCFVYGTSFRHETAAPIQQG